MTERGLNSPPSRRRDDRDREDRDKYRRRLSPDNDRSKRRRRSPSPDSERYSRGRRDDRSRRHRSRSMGSENASRRKRDRSRESSHRRREHRGKVRDRDGDRDGDKIRSHRRRDEKRSSRRHPSISPSRSASPQPSRRSKNPLPSQQDAFTKTPKDSSNGNDPTPVPEKEKEKRNFGNTGRLAAETNTVTSTDGSTSTVLKYNEPSDARKPPPKERWRLYIFKDENLLETIELGDRSCWLVGRDKLVADLPIEHPSSSKQHAALQFRYVEKRNSYGDLDARVRPYLLDLESANGTTLNGDAVPPRRFMELMDKDVLKFGLSSREYVLLLPPRDG